MIKVDCYSEFDQSEWCGIVKNLKGNALHLPDVWRPDFDQRNTWFLILRTEQDIVGACMALCLEKKVLKLFKGSRTLYLPTIPAFIEENEKNAEDIYSSLLGFAKKSGFDYLSIGARWGSDLSCILDFGKYVDTRLTEFTIDLTGDLEAIMASFHKKHRKNIRKAEEHGMEIIEDNSLNGLMELHKLQESSSDRAASKGNIYKVQKKDFFIRAHENIYSKNIGSILFAKHEGKYISGLAYLRFNKRAITVRSGSLAEAYTLSAPYHVQWDLIRRLKNESFEVLNIGGVSGDAADPAHVQYGLYQFKKGFGSVENHRTGVTIPVK